MKILRYTPEVQKQIGSKVKAEPWLHIGFSGEHYAIWIWDTRQIVGTGKADGEKVQGSPAKDNHKPLSGEHAEAFVFKKSRHEPVSQDEPLVLQTAWGYNDNRNVTFPSRYAKLVPWSKANKTNDTSVFNPKVLLIKEGDPFGDSSEGHSFGDYAPCMLSPNVIKNKDDKEIAKFLKDCPTVADINKYRGRYFNAICAESDATYWGDDKPQPKPFNGYDKWGNKVVSLPVK